MLAPRAGAQGRKVFDLTAETGTTTLLPGATIATWGYNGAIGAGAAPGWLASLDSSVAAGSLTTAPWSTP
ncbi:MAG TPA: hypothetical protein VGF32_25365 [Streptosporangiaceae bacterium]